jgi:hypothetical protein
MKRAIVLLMVAFFGLAGWNLAGRLSPDALGMAVGLVFGLLAPLPAVLLVLAAQRRRGAYTAMLLEDEYSDGADLLPDWEYETTVTRELDDSGLEYTERFTLLVPKRHAHKQLTGRNL